MIQLTLKTITDFEGWGEYHNVEVHENGERTHVTGIPVEATLTNLEKIRLALERLEHEQTEAAWEGI